MILILIKIVYAKKIITTHSWRASDDISCFL